MMSEARNIKLMNQANDNRSTKYCTRSNGAELITLINKVFEITRKEWRMMNEARNIDLMDPAYVNRWTRKSTRANTAEVVSLVSKKAPENMTPEYLNEKLAFFYNNGGPIMEI